MANQKYYLLKEAVRGFRGAKLSSLTSVFTIGISTSVLGFGLMAVFFIHSLSRFQPDDRSIRVYMAPEAESPEFLQQFHSRLDFILSIDSIVFISKDKALEEFTNEFDSEMLDALPYNPLPPSFILYPGVPYRSAVQSRLLREKLRSMPGVEAVSRISLYFSWMDKWKIPVLLIVTSLFLFIGSGLVLIVSNAVKLNLYSRKNLVENMKYCGAGETFITVPFLLEGLILGAIGSLLGMVTTFAAYLIFRMVIPIIDIPDFWRIPLMILVFTSLLGSLASFRTVRRFVHEESVAAT